MVMVINTARTNIILIDQIRIPAEFICNRVHPIFSFWVQQRVIRIHIMEGRFTPWLHKRGAASWIHEQRCSTLDTRTEVGQPLNAQRHSTVCDAHPTDVTCHHSLSIIILSPTFTANRPIISYTFIPQFRIQINPMPPTTISVPDSTAPNNTSPSSISSRHSICHHNFFHDTIGIPQCICSCLFQL
ncbi:hypothetical protein SLEP1_g12958 [Rubroshorea leprosula]|uniref:Uncharacterized protein n=1 Tax=Rubroshorea leprosula TaxID=152421 RepID=A0AAV5INM0_9ROSI|nr:hypothetical protein SLEP1_g12958 [Rubroshorea leprosula]